MPASGFKKTFIKYNLIITIVFVVAAIAVSFYFYILPYYENTIAEKQREIEESNQELEKRLAFFKKLQKLKKEYESIQAIEEEKIYSVIPNSNQIPELLLQLEAIAEESGIEISSVTFSDSVNNNENYPGLTASNSNDTNPDPIQSIAGLGRVSFSFSLTGSNYSKLKIFLDKIERNVRLMDIKSINFAAGAESVSISLETYYYVKE